VRKPTWLKSRASMAFGTAVVLVAGSFALAASSGASLSDSNFEIDANANLKVDTSGRIDWLAESPETAMRTGVISRSDQLTGGSDDSFGGGAKEDSAVPGVVSGGIPPNKSDLKNFGIFQETNSAGSFLHLFWARVQDPSGSTNMDFEFNHNQCAYEMVGTPPVRTETAQSECSANGVTPVRTDGDRLITYDLSNGGATATIGMRIWGESGWSPDVPLDGAKGTVNTTLIPATEAGGLGPLTARTFGEASIDLSTVFTTSECQSFGSAYLKSRSSDSFNSALKDFIAPEPVSVSNCGTINIHKQDDSPTPVALANVTFTLWNDNAPVAGAAPHGVEDTVTNPALACTTNASGNCTISEIPAGDYWVVEGTPPTGYLPAPDQAVSVGRDSTLALTFVNNRNPAKLAIHKQDDAATPNPLGDVTFTLYTDNAPVGGSRGAEDAVTDPALSCTTAANGDCTISNIVVPGPYWVVETTPKTGYDAAADQHVDIVPGGDNTATPLTFVNARNFKVIVLVCNESAGGKLHPSAVTINGINAGTSLSTAGTSSSLTESALCGITAGDLGGLSSAATAYPATVTIQP
jgi:hypothetical protein